MRRLPVVAVVGRPNVGKSTFFNRVLGRRLAIVEDRPGVTRDRNFAQAEWAGRSFYMVDTGGLIEDPDEPMDRLIRIQVLAAIDEADVVVLLVDGKVGPHPLDQWIADRLRASDRSVVLVVNKIDDLGSESALGHHEFWGLGLGDPLPVSSLSGKGSGDVLDEIVSRFPDVGPGDEEEDALRIAVIGKPNVGKSSLVNQLIGEERLIVSDQAGTTRDSIDTPVRFHGRTLVFVDTAGLRRQSRIDEQLEYYTALRTEAAIERADVCLLLIDATEPLHVQDIKVAEKAWEAGCGVVMVANKWDLVEKKETMTAPNLQKTFADRVPFLKWVPVIFASAVTGQRLTRIIPKLIEVAEERQRRIPTHEVNEVLAELLRRAKPPHSGGREVRIFYGTQTSVAPPEFVLWSNIPDAVPPAFQRYLTNGFRAAWSFEGVPIRLRLRARREE